MNKATSILLVLICFSIFGCGISVQDQETTADRTNNSTIRFEEDDPAPCCIPSFDPVIAELEISGGFSPDSTRIQVFSDGRVVRTHQPGYLMVLTEFTITTLSPESVERLQIQVSRVEVGELVDVSDPDLSGLCDGQEWDYRIYHYMEPISIATDACNRDQKELYDLKGRSQASVRTIKNVLESLLRIGDFLEPVYAEPFPWASCPLVACDNGIITHYCEGQPNNPCATDSDEL